ncbi:hypothetical protein AGMMS49982_11460 [Bacteroidia bacterium]|nr:hypothetical protein AGMMS49982_11460 [Bacteroidia bacterium]
MENKKVKIFISYSHENTDLFKEFQKGLESHSQNSTNIKWDIWTDVEISAGAFWHESIQDKVKESDAAILLVSQHFFASDYIKNEEFKKFVERYKKENFIFFPVLLCDCEFYEQWEELTEIQFFAPQGQDYGIDQFKNKIVPYDYLKESNIKNTYFKNCVKAFEKTIKLNRSVKKKSSETNTTTKNESQSQQLEERFQDFKNQVMNHIKQQDDKIGSLEKSVSFLIDEAYQGLKPIDNCLKILFDKEKRKYSFEFEKQFEIIATEVLPIRYETQFYANKFLTNGEKAKDFYEKNKIYWKDLGVGASVAILDNNGKKFGEETEVTINPKSISGNFIPFDISFVNKDTEKALNLKTGNTIKIKYWYSVPIFLWGSYINRHLSYYNEPLVVEIEYDKKYKSNKIIEKIESLIGPKSTPSVLPEEKYSKTQSYHTSNIVQKIEFKGDRFERFRITWDSLSYFGGDETNTEDGEDELGRTNK